MTRKQSDRRVNAYEDATVLDDAMLLETWQGGENQLESTVTVTKGAYTFRFGEIPHFVDNDWYEGRAEVSNVKRTLGELLAPSIQFSEGEIKLSNVDGVYNRYMVGGPDYFSFNGAQVIFKIGLRDIGSTYRTVFDGVVKSEGGFQRSVQTFTLSARDVFEDLNRDNPLPQITLADYPDAFSSSLGKIIPMVLGDWEVGFTFADQENFKLKIGAVDFEIKNKTPANLHGGITGYYVGGTLATGSFFVFAIGNYTPDNIANCYIKRGDNVLVVDFNPAPVVKAGRFTVQVLGLIDSTNAVVPYVPVDGDIALVSVKIPYAAGQYSNAVRIAQEIITTLGYYAPAGFDTASWDALANKVTPPESAIANIKARLWVGKASAETTPLSLALSLLEQVRVEMFVDQNQKLKLTSLHTDSFPSAPTRRVDQFQVGEQSFAVKGDDRTYFNAAESVYAFTPITDKTALITSRRQNTNSVSKSGKFVVKSIECPNLYVESDVINQVDEFVRFYSMGIEYIECDLAWVHLLADIGEFVSFNFTQGSVSFADVPCQIRDKTIEFKTGASKVRMIGFHVFPYGAYVPPNASLLLSSATQTITNS